MADFKNKTVRHLDEMLQANETMGIAQSSSVTRTGKDQNKDSKI